MGVDTMGFILTMRNVNLKLYIYYIIYIPCFILTMRNVNVSKLIVKVRANYVLY